MSKKKYHPTDIFIITIIIAGLILWIFCGCKKTSDSCETKKYTISKGDSIIIYKPTIGEFDLDGPSHCIISYEYDLNEDSSINVTEITCIKND